MSEALPRVFGPYLLLAKLGHGAAGTAYLARPIDEERGIPAPVVVKCLHQRLRDNDEYVRRFRHEAELAVRVDSSHIARVYDAGAVGEVLYIALEYVPGWTLGRVLSAMASAKRQCPLPIARNLILGTLDGLQALHEAKDPSGRGLEVVHRDISPKNVMVADDGEVRLIDLGLGKSKVQDWQTVAGRVMGSPGYMPLEQITGQTVDHRADLYAVGVILHELLTGERYLKPDSSVNMIRAAMEKTFEAPSLKRPEITKLLDRIVEKAMGPEAEARYQTADAFRRALSAAVPEPAEGAVAAFVDSLLKGDQQARVAEIDRLLSVTFSVDEIEPEIQRTQLFVRREGVSDLGDVTRYRPTVIGGPKGMATKVLPRPPLAVELRAELERDQRQKSRLLAPPVVAPDRAETPARSVSSQMPSVGPSSGRPLVIAALLVALGAGLALGIFVGAGPDATPVAATEVPVTEIEKPLPSVEATQHQVGVEPRVEASPEPAIDPKEPSTAKRVDRRPPPPRAVRPVLESPPPTTGASDEEDVLRLSQKLQQDALAIKTAAPGDSVTAQACDKFLSRIAMARSRKDSAQALSQLKLLEAELPGLKAH